MAGLVKPLFARPDPAEAAFAVRWILAGCAGIALYAAYAEGFALLHADLAAAPSRSGSEAPGAIEGYSGVDAHDMAAIAEGLSGIGVTLIATALPWFTLRPLYDRPSLAGWLGWMVVGMVLFMVSSAIILLSMVLSEDLVSLTPVTEIGAGLYALLFLTDLLTKLGYALALAMIGWRIGLSLWLALVVASICLAMLGLSSVINDLVSALRGIDQDQGWGQGLDGAETWMMTQEVLVLGLFGAAGVILGNRWHARTVEDPVFD